MLKEKISIIPKNVFPDFGEVPKEKELSQKQDETNENRTPLFGAGYTVDPDNIKPFLPESGGEGAPAKERVTLVPAQMLTVLEDNQTAERSPRKRFAKAGDNAQHPHTVNMRMIKSALRLTTIQLVNELNAYEKAHHSDKFHRSADPNTPSWLPMTAVLMASYLQGWVVKESFMAHMHKRLENLFWYKNEQGQVKPSREIREIMDGWYKALGIDPKDTSVSPTRQLAKLIAPYYKRPVLAAVGGIFHLGLPVNGGQIYEITDIHGETHQFTLNPNEPVLIKDGQKIAEGDVIQYSVLMQTHRTGDKVVLTHEPSINHTTFYRWYANNKLPRSVKTIELVQAAVDEAAKHLAST